MAMHAQELVGARVSGADGQIVGTVEQVFHDDADGQPAWVRVKGGSGERFVPLSGSRMAAGGLSVPFESQKIMSGPQIEADRHMSAAQAAELVQYYGITIPTQTGPRERAGSGTGTTMPGQRPGSEAGMTGPRETAETETGTGTDEDWLVRLEERMNIGTELLESGRVRLHKYVDVEPVEQTVHVFHEEYEIERVPITEQERISGVIAEGEKEIILHEERPVLRTEAVPVERIRLVTRRVPEDQVVRGEVRKERIEVEGDGLGREEPAADESGQRRSRLNRRRGE